MCVDKLLYVHPAYSNTQDTGRAEEFIKGLRRLSLCLLRTDVSFNQFNRLVRCGVHECLADNNEVLVWLFVLVLYVREADREGDRIVTMVLSSRKVSQVRGGCVWHYPSFSAPRG